MTESDEESFHSATEDFDNDAAPEQEKLFVPKPTAATDAKGDHAAAGAPQRTTSVPSAAPQMQREKEEAVKKPQKQQQRAEKEEASQHIASPTPDAEETQKKRAISTSPARDSTKGSSSGDERRGAAAAPQGGDDEEDTNGWGEFSDDEAEDEGGWGEWDDDDERRAAGAKADAGKKKRRQPAAAHHAATLPKAESASSTESSAVNSPKSKRRDGAGSDEEWFQEQLAAERKERASAKRKDSAKKEAQKKGGGSLWDWTGLNDVVSAVGEGFSSVVEQGLGLPAPETMAKLSVAERRKLMEEAQHIKEPEPSLSSDNESNSPESGVRGSASTHSASVPGAFGGLFSGIVHGGLDVLESLGKKTFETLTVKDEEDASGRRFFLQQDKTQSLSNVLRELRANQDEAESHPASGRPLMGYGSTTVERFNTNFVSLFEKSEGMVHLEGLELLSKGREQSVGAYATSDSIFEDKLVEFCVEDVSECATEDFDHEMRKCLRHIGLPYKADNVFQTDKDLLDELSCRQQAVDAGEEIVVESVHEAAISALAKLTAHSLQALHKLAQLIVIANDVPDVESLFAFTYLLCRRLSFYASQYANILSLIDSPTEKVDEVVTNIFFECSNACHYIRKALELLRPFFSS